MELPGEHTALHGLQLARVPQRCGPPLDPSGLGEHTALHGLQLARVPRDRLFAGELLGEHTALHRL